MIADFVYNSFNKPLNVSFIFVNTRNLHLLTDITVRIFKGVYISGWNLEDGAVRMLAADLIDSLQRDLRLTDSPRPSMAVL